MLMKGYDTQYGYMGYVKEEGRYILFSSEQEYFDYLGVTDALI